ncbi:MAG: 4Fe-4S binding protein [Desulfovibrio sp.]|jgi:heterodisulfide reductase subunit A|nr:4Fe-4S binding protein [Desulfovibrio sp.]
MPDTKQAVLVVGAGVAGMQAALDLANFGRRVHLVEQDSHLGGQTLRLDKVYPTDHCAFCPVWTHAFACREHPRITVLTGTRFKGLRRGPEGDIALLEKAARLIDGDKCVFCGKCMEVCPRKALLGRAPDLPWDPAQPPVPWLDAGRCDACGKCGPACPAGAIDAARQTETFEIAVGDCIFAGGFQEPRPAPAPEFGGHTHPDILTAMAFETLIAEYNAVPGEKLRCPSDGRPVENLAFIQCAGARDRRFLSHCSAVCCMHAAKQASWLKRRQPDLDIAVFYTDLRTPGKGQEAYMKTAEKLGVRFVRRRPGLAAPVDGPSGKGIALRHEINARVATTLADIVVLNGGLACCPCPEEAAEAGAHPCGFCSEPADIANSVIQAGSAAALICGRQTGKDASSPAYRGSGGRP